MQNIKRAFGTKQILKDLDIIINRGDFISILGQSGSGKSTFLNILGLLDKNYEGKYLFFGEEIKAKKDYTNIRSQKIGFIFQMYYLLPKLSIIENILLPYLYRDHYDSKAVDNRLNELIERLNLKGILNQPCESLSGGEKQRVAIARALIHDPEVIICDEPTGNLDNKNCNTIINILKEEQQKGKTIIVVTHSQEVAKASDKIYYLREGVLKTDG
jgi:ABC-type lipoprotein export system ATPase subunit